MSLFIHISLSFLIYSIGGWLCECIYCSIPAKHFVNRGFLRGPYCPIYGCGALLTTGLLASLNDYPAAVFLCGLLLTSVLEYLTSWIMEVLFHTKWWDYSKRRFHINGRVCLRNSILFGLMSLFVIYFLQPRVDQLIASLPLPTAMLICILFIWIFIYDLYQTVSALLHRNQTFLELEASMSELKECFESLPIMPISTLKERVQAVLDSTDADERLKETMHHLRAKLTISEKYHRVQHRLQSAFPNQHLSSSRAALEAFIEGLITDRKS